MNGVDSKRILILEDGIPLSGRVMDRIELNLIDADKVDQIEIVKGPSSALYGSDAMGGVINLISRPPANRFQAELNARTGSNDLYSGNLTLVGKVHPVKMALNLDHFQKGYDQVATDIEVKQTESNGVNSKIQFGHPLLGDLTAGGSYKEDAQQSKIASDGGFTDNKSRVRNKALHAKLNRNLSDRFTIQAIGYYTDNFRTYESKAVHSPRPATVDTTTDCIVGFKTDLSYQSLRFFNCDFGVDYSDNNYASPRIASATSTRRQLGTFSQIETNPIKQLTLIIGVRVDKISQLDAYFSPRVSGMYTLNPNLKIRSGWGKGFRAPSFLELYSDFLIPIPNMPIRLEGNPYLKPEKSSGLNFGVEYVLKQTALIHATVFQSQFKEMIIDFQRDRQTFGYLNVKHATFTGFEFQGRINLRKNLNTIVSYNYIHIDQKEKDVAFSRISPHAAAFDVHYKPFGNRFKITLRDQFFGKRNILILDERTRIYAFKEKEGYHLVDLIMTYKLSNGLLFKFGTVNLNNYTDRNYGPWIGRKMFLGVQTKLQAKETL
jgi:outer membrane receptor for ferrienterochelin and colicins